MHTAPDSNAFEEEEDDVFGGINQLTQSLDNLDDRGLVLSLSAFAEDALGSLLKAFMLTSEATSQLLEGFNAPLGTLSARVKAAYAIGLITKNQLDDLERLRKIRNEFAHTWRPIDLNQQKIAAQIKLMSYSPINDRFPETHKEKMQSSVSWLLVELRSTTHQISKQGIHALVIGNHLIPGFVENFPTQLKEVSKQLSLILQQLESSKEDKCEFYKRRLERLSLQAKLTVQPKTARQRQKLLAIQDDVNNALLQHSPQPTSKPIKP